MDVCSSFMISFNQRMMRLSIEWWDYESKKWWQSMTISIFKNERLIADHLAFHLKKLYFHNWSKDGIKTQWSSIFVILWSFMALSENMFFHSITHSSIDFEAYHKVYKIMFLNQKDATKSPHNCNSYPHNDESLHHCKVSKTDEDWNEVDKLRYEDWSQNKECLIVKS